MSKFIRKCPDCDKEIFYTLKGALTKAIKNNSVCHSCSKKGENNPHYGKGDRQRGKNNPNYGNPNNYSHSSKVRLKISEANKGSIRENMMGNKNPMKKQINKDKVSAKMKGRNNHRYGKKPWNYRIGFELLDEFKKYMREVINITEKNLHMVEGYNPSKRGRAGIKDAFQIDHIISIRKGFREGIPPSKIGHYSNLQFITWEENIARRELFHGRKND